jgi:hypothetical protein
MSIVVKKSKNVNLYTATSNALASVLETLEEQASSVVSVSVLANFSVDGDTALEVDAPTVTQGLVVCVMPDYKLSKKDMSWFHPNIGRGRSIFSLATPVTKQSLQNVTLSTPSSSVGEFSISRPDEFGSEDVSHHIIVDSAPNLRKLYLSWLEQGVTAGEVATQWKRTQFGKNKSISLHSCCSRADMVADIATTCSYTDTVNDVLTDNVNVYFTNDCVKHTSEMLMKSSTLGGYRMYQASDKLQRFYPASFGHANHFYKWKDMNNKNIARIASCCSWDDDLTFNTQVMRPPSLRNNAIRSMEEEYQVTPKDSLVMRLTHLTGSATIVDKMTPADVFQLTPATDSQFISTPIDPSHPVFAHLVGNLDSIQQQFPSFQLINPKYMRGNRLKLPREVYQQIV